MKKYSELLENAIQNNRLNNEYLEVLKLNLTKTNDLLVAKEKEYEDLYEYMCLTLTVIQGLKSEVASIESLISSLNKETQSSVVYQNSLIELKNRIEPKTSNTKENRPEMSISLHTMSEVREMAEELTQDTSSDSYFGNDKDYIEFIKKNCVNPEYPQNVEIWERRVLVKYYMESGLSTVDEILKRYNKYADSNNKGKATSSSISKDIRQIFDGSFSLVTKEHNKNINQRFRPASMLTVDEISQINQLIIDNSSLSHERIKGIVETYAEKNLLSMSVYKLRAVKSFLEEQLNN